MPWTRPTIQELIDRAAADVEARIPGSDARPRRSNLNVLARVNAGAAHGLYGRLDYLARQIIPDTADVEELERWCAAWNVQRKAAALAKGNVTFTGTNGTNIPAASQLTRSDGALYTTDALAVIAAGVALVAVTAVAAGAAGNLDAAALLTLSTPIAGINGSATVAAGGLSQGADTESDDSLRARLIARISKPPQGGDKDDYLAWALEVAGVTRAWCYPLELGAGTVTVRFVRDADAGSIIPDAGEVAAVQAYIDARRPVTANVTVVAPIADPLAFVFTLLDPNTQATKDAISASLTNLLQLDAQPGGTLLLSHIREAISLAVGENNYTLTAPAADVVSATGHMPTLGAITWP
jgi:uncharacterized phage protein gp47/JayE